jgi:transcriptional antiterminator RfaH
MISQPKWYALYTRSRAEKLLAALLTQRGIENFLPLKKVLKNYSGRKKWVEEPLIHSYLFVHVGLKDYNQPLYLPGAVRYVCFDGKAVPIPDEQINTLKQLVYHSPLDLQVTCEQLHPGERVEIYRGPMMGVNGELIQIRGNNRLLLRLNSLGLCVHVEVGLEDIKPLYEINYVG